MSDYRPINKIVKAQGFQMGNIWVKQALPGGNINQIDPFLLLHHGGPYEIKAGSDHRKMGVGPHPHRGFEPVSFVFQGSLQHRDSVGNNDILDDGDIQWMTSGKGIIHSERVPKKVTQGGGVQEFIQLWVNLPAQYKMTTPGYQNLRRKDFPIIKPDKGEGNFYLVSGSLENKKGPTKTFTPINSLKGEMNSGAVKTIALPVDHNALLYIVRGKIKLNDERDVDAENMVHFGNSGTRIKIEATENTLLLLLSGKPIGEPIATYGPFVMNNNREIMTAIQDYQEGRMGELKEVFE